MKKKNDVSSVDNKAPTRRGEPEGEPEAAENKKKQAEQTFVQWCEVSSGQFRSIAFRATRLLRAGCWRAGRLRAPFIALRLLWRDAPLRRCGGGRNLAVREAFERQRQLSARMLDWYAQYVAVLRRLALM